ncbi:tetraprenyl-beta-curcumene synthase family protein [Salipaludibacillus sp. CF4.18]|uniref:tetraprenyl-beta-curcumene synthase family protein n=1 Tax=Salipaludibacillus sp. CF4.18 TaxID=3373081 RepID=UPI003EE5D531
MNLPKKSWTMMYKIYKHVIPTVHEFITEWRELAEKIPNEELRSQALMSIDSKTFHCEGGAVYALLSGENFREAVRFIVAYQTISDYLDNLCDRSTSQNPDDFQALHESMPDALTPDAPTRDYYRFREEKDDGGYLKTLVNTCQECIKRFPSYSAVHSENVSLSEMYSDLQVHKHVKEPDRVPRLTAWFQGYRSRMPDMEWFEFSACTGSTLGIFCLTAYAAGKDTMTKEEANVIKNGYFPWVQGLHILMDYFIDREEDKEGGDLNFCFYYETEEDMLRRMEHFFHEAEKSLKSLPDSAFHRLINNGLLAIYLADAKVKQDPQLRKQGNRLIRSGGASTVFFYLNGWVYRQVSKT